MAAVFRWIFSLVVACLAMGSAYCQSYDDGLRELSTRIGNSLESRGPQVGTVLDLNGLDGPVTQLGKLVAQDVFDQLISGAPSVTWIDPSRRDFIIQENQLAADRLMDPATQKQLGKLLGLSVIVSGTITELGDSARIQLRAIEIETARVIGSASTTVQLPEALKRLNDRRAVSSTGSSGRAEMQNDVLVLRARGVSLVPYDRESFKWAASLEVENISGVEVYVRFVEMSLGTCPFDGGRYGRVDGIASWGFERYYGETKDRQERLSLATLLAPGQVTTFSVTDYCELNMLPAFDSGLADVSVGFAADIGERYARLSISVRDADVRNSGAAR